MIRRRFRGETSPFWLPFVALAVLVVPPLLLTRRGEVLADGRTPFLIDPSAALDGALRIWDPHRGLGSVAEGDPGHLWPLGTYHWILDTVGVPDWIAQRLWMAALLLAAGGGVLFLARSWRWRPSSGAAAAFVYALSPLVTTGVLDAHGLLPFSGLPWLLALTVRALHTRGWRHPALFGLTFATIGSVNVTSAVLVGLVPVLWVLYSVFYSHDVSRARALTTVAKLGSVTVAVNLWWIAGASVQVTNGLDIPEFPETAEVVADASNAPEILRGLGSWAFYDADRLGPTVTSSVDYTQQLWLLGFTYLLPTIGLFSLGVVRWRHRAFLVGVVLIGTVVAVGAHPWNAPSPLGAAIKALLLTDAGLALRALPRAVPLVALGLALATGSLVGAAAEQRLRRGLLGAVAVAALAYAAVPPLWTGQLVPDDLRRPDEIPQYWQEAAEYLDQRPDQLRILELPGTDLASYRWGTTVEPVTPALVDRPYADRGLLPQGSEASADLLRSLDLRLQDGTMPDQGLAAIARLMGVGDVVLRNDLRYERYDTPRPRSSWDLLRRMPGLGEARTFGVGVPNRPTVDLPMVDEAHLARDGSLPEAPAVAAFPVSEPVPIVRTHSDEQAVLLSGDGSGIVDAATAGLLRGDELIRYSASLTDDPLFVREHLRDSRGLIVTDTNRKRAQRWTSLRHTEGYTEEVDGGLLREDRSDTRFDYLGDRPGTRTVAEHRGLSVRATGYGDPDRFTPEDRPVNAADGDVQTAWRVGAGTAVGHRIELTAPETLTTDRIRLLQPQAGDADGWITEVVVRFDGEDPIRVRLDDSSRTAPGQAVTFDERTFQTVGIEIRDVTAAEGSGTAGPGGVGFAEIDVAGTQVREVIRMPADLLEAGGFRTLRYPLAIVQTRQRTTATDATRADEEPSMVRALELPTARAYGLRGTARLSSRAPAPVLDALLGRGGLPAGQPSVTASTTLPGGLAHLPSNALDGDPLTRWTGALDAALGSMLRIEAPEPVTFDRLGLVLVDDDEHSLPTELSLVVDGVATGSFPLDHRPAAGGLVQAEVGLPRPVTGSTVEVVFSAIERRRTTDWHTGAQSVLPVSVAELVVGDGAQLSVPARPMVIETGCRDDLVRVGGQPVPVQASGSLADALAGHGLELTNCGDGITIPGGDVLFRTAPGRDTGIDVDQLVWRSGAGGAPFVLDVPIVPEDHAATTDLEILSQDDTTVDVRVHDARPGTPFWVVLGQSHNDGWELQAEDAVVEGPYLVDGYANGFLVTPEAATFEASVHFVPQNRVEVGLLLSLVALVAALALASQRAPEIRPMPIPRQEPLRRLRAFSYEGALPTRRDARILGLAAGVVAGVLATPAVGLAVAVLAGFAARREGWRVFLTLIPAVLLALVGIYVIGLQFRNELAPGQSWPSEIDLLHPLAMAAVILLAVDVAIDRLWAHRSEFR